MSKRFATVLVMMLVFPIVQAQLPAQDIGMNLYLNVGLLTDETFTFDTYLWSVGAQFDIHLGSMLMISPECDVIVYEFEFDPVLLSPGVLLNIKLSNFFFGAGLTNWFIIGTSIETVDLGLAFKANAGIRTSNLRLAAYVVSDLENIFENTIIFGVTLGFGM